MPTAGAEPTPLAYVRAGPRTGGPPVVLVHAGVADRRMWDPVWPALTASYDVVRVDLRGFGESVQRPDGLLSPVDDLVATIAGLGIARFHLVGASYGAGVAVETTLAHPSLVASLTLVAPGGSLIAEATDELRAFVAAESAALSRGDLPAAVEANLEWWLAGPHRALDEIDPALVAQVRRMQRRAFEITADWDDVEESEPDPPALERLDAVEVPTLVVAGGLDVDAITRTAETLVAGIADAALVIWPDVAHLPSMERPADFVATLAERVSPAT
ncbi:alpha/beta fold hydrolase [Mumia sp. DW29H23]|uniref:alpha/beta fold hydrolase n=1 Tax=Mumia sp. DW29H23 TaxID=3421241 RepID=UPI003D69AFD3